MAQGKTKSHYVPSLDGLRALAVLAVIAYHMSMGWAPGGLLGVTMFFVLSGYLITGLLIKEYNDSGTINLANFWLRRVRRIIPAVVFAVVGIGFLCTIFNHVLLTKMRPDVVPTLLFFNNWWQIIHNVSYFEALGQPSPLTHFWSLAIEEQFYLVWPVVLLVCMRFGVQRTAMQRGTLVLAALSALAMIIMFDPHADPSRVYYGTDTRAFSLLIGAYLAFIWPHNELAEQAGESMTPLGRIIFNVVGIAAVVGLLVMVAVTNGFSPFIYRGGLVLCSILTALAIAVMVHPISWVGKFFALPPFVWIGKVSYSMYLWHYPIILLTTPGNLVGGAPWWLRIIQLVLIFGMSAFSYYVVEDPIRHGAIGNFIDELRMGDFTLGEWIHAHMVPVIIGVLFFAVPIAGWAFVPDTSAVNNAGAMNTPSLVDRVKAAGQKAKARHDAEIVKPDPLLIGDSVPMSMEGYGTFQEVFPDGFIDAAVGRQFYSAPELYAEYRDANMVGNVVVFALGTNGYATLEDGERLMKEIGKDQMVWFVNTRSPEAYVDESNATLQRLADTHDNAHLIDWYSYSANRSDLFDGDGTHLVPEASREYAQLIYDNVSPYLEKKSDSGNAETAAAA